MLYRNFDVSFDADAANVDMQLSGYRFRP